MPILDISRPPPVILGPTPGIQRPDLGILRPTLGMLGPTPGMLRQTPGCLDAQTIKYQNALGRHHFIPCILQNFIGRILEQQTLEWSKNQKEEDCL